MNSRDLEIRDPDFPRVIGGLMALGGVTTLWSVWFDVSKHRKLLAGGPLIRDENVFMLPMGAVLIVLGAWLLARGTRHSSALGLVLTIGAAALSLAFAVWIWPTDRASAVKGFYVAAIAGAAVFVQLRKGLRSPRA